MPGTIRTVSSAAALVVIAQLVTGISIPGRAVAQDYQIETVADGLANPWSIAWLPDGTILVTERPGRLRMIRDGRLVEPPIDGIPEVYNASQGGLFDVLPDPEFRSNRWIYLSFAYGTPETNATRVVRGRLEGMALIDLEVVFTAQPTKDTPVHYGGRMIFLPDRTLVVGLGDGFDYREAAQQLNNHFGKLVRMRRDGSVPLDNPFVGRDDALPEIYSYGHRNVQGLAYDAAAGILWQHEHGPRGGDEVNVIGPGGNYGWPAATHGIDYSGALVSPYTSRPGMVDPVHVWSPSIAPAGMTLYRGDLFPAWDGKLIVSALAARHARLLSIENGDVIDDRVILEEPGERLRDIRTGPDGAIWVLTDASPGKILRILPADEPADEPED